MILAKNELIDSILKGLYNAIGTSTQAQGIAFALPVDEVIGIDNNLNIKNINKNMKKTDIILKIIL